METFRYSNTYYIDLYSDVNERRGDSKMTREQFYGIQYEEIFPYIEKLEQRIAELSAPKTCEGCRWFYGESQECMSYCSRGFEDKYEPKKDI